MDPDELLRHLRDHAARLGLEWIGVAPPQAPDRDAAAYRRWLADGHHAGMGYMARPDAITRRERLDETLEEVRTAVVVADPYSATDAAGVPDDPSLGVIARYARGRDYHRVLAGKLRAMARDLPEGVTARGYTDTGPILERALGRLAGLGWQGRNTMLIHPQRGSYFLLGVLLLDVELPVATEAVPDRCGTCSACLDGCPTGALLGRDESGAPVLDARKCISYWTIETDAPIPHDLREAMGNRVFGCDICQELCPWNRFARPEGDPAYAARGPGDPPAGVEPLPGEAGVRHPGTAAPRLVDLFRMTEPEWRVWTRGAPLRRAGYVGFRRSVAVALGNWLGGAEGGGGDPGVDVDPVERMETVERAQAAGRADPGERVQAVDLLRAAAAHDPSPVVREHAEWALGRMG